MYPSDTIETPGGKKNILKHHEEQSRAFTKEQPSTKDGSNGIQRAEERKDLSCANCQKGV